MERRKRFKRFQKIINTLVRHGFGQIIHDFRIEEFFEHIRLAPRREKKGAEELSKPVRLRMVLEELGPTFIKFGQLLSTRADVLPPAYVKELRRLQDQVPPFSFAEAKKTIKNELHYDPEFLFESITETPMAAASIGQVHEALLTEGEKVVVKVQRPGIRKTIEQDVAILEEIASIVDRYTTIGKMYRFKDIVEEFKLIIFQELNFHHEGRNAERLQKSLADEDYVYIPAVYWSYTTQKVLTLEHVDGITLNEPEKLREKGHSTRELVEKLTRAYLKQIFVSGFFHGDPHPGNIGVTDDGTLYLLDFGIAGSINEDQRSSFNRLVLGFFSRDIEQVLHAIMKLGVITEDTDERHLRWDLERLQEKYFEIPLKDVNFGHALHELIEISFKQKVILPPEFTLLAKTFLTLEGLISELEPDFSIAELLEPLKKDLLRSEISVKKISSQLTRNVSRYARLLEIFPDRMVSFLEKSADGKLKFRVEVSELNHVLHRLNNMVNRISFSIVLASLIVGLCLILQFVEAPLFIRFPIAEIGFIIAAMMGFWWLWAILRSGRL